MKQIFWSMILGAAAGIFGTLMVPAHAQVKYEGPRMQYLGKQEMTGNVRFRFFHDQETGQEVICADTVNADACYLTGRKW